MVSKPDSARALVYRQQGSSRQTIGFRAFSGTALYISRPLALISFHHSPKRTLWPFRACVEVNKTVVLTIVFVSSRSHHLAPPLARANEEDVPASSNVAKKDLFLLLIKGAGTVLSPLDECRPNRHILGSNLPSSEARPRSSS